MPDLSEREKTLLKLVIKKVFFEYQKCVEEHYSGANHADHKIDIHDTYNDIALWFSYLDWSLFNWQKPQL